jgi:hypothetical protein
MSTHDRIQEAVRRYMGTTYGRYPAAIIVSSATWQQLSTHAIAISKMRPTHVIEHGTPCAIIAYLGMRLLVRSGDFEFLLRDKLPVSLAGAHAPRTVRLPMARRYQG